MVTGDQQMAPAGTRLPVEPALVVRDAGGRPVPGVAVHFTVTSGGGWVTDAVATTAADGRVSTVWHVGPEPGRPQALVASVGTLSAGLTATATPLVAGTTHFGRNGYVEFQVGDAPLVLSAPHGGALTPAEIPDRTVGTTVTDLNTEPLARQMAAAFLAETGQRPHLIVIHLRRTKLDGNREVVEAAAGNRWAIQAWQEYHGFIEAARVAAAGVPGVPFYVDIHGHGHPAQRLEWGYLLTAADLALDDGALDAGPFAARSSVRSRAPPGGTGFAALLRGPASLGGLFAAAGFPSVPSPAMPSPGGDPYFNGGYSTARHGSRDGGVVSGVQLEANFLGVRDSEASRAAFAAAAATILAGWVGTGN